MTAGVKSPRGRRRIDAHVQVRVVSDPGVGEVDVLPDGRGGVAVICGQEFVDSLIGIVRRVPERFRNDPRAQFGKFAALREVVVPCR